MSNRPEKMLAAGEFLICPRNSRPPIKIPSSNLWGDAFTSFAFDEQEQETLSTAIESLKADTRTMLMVAEGGRQIALIDTLERLGLGYHFEGEIEDKLMEIYNSHETHDLLITATRFRLLRQHHYRVPSSVFKKFTDQYNKFLGSLASDAEGLLSLYEASHTRMADEVLLEDALAFTTHHLTSILPELQSPLKDKVKRALHQPLHKGVPIIEIQQYIRIYPGWNSRDDELLLKLAKLNFKFLQNLYKKELCQVSRWWYALNLPLQIPFLRDRIVECYILSLVFHFEPKYSHLRVETAKNAQMCTVIDDIYDDYGTLEENRLFTDAFEIWDINAIDGLPDMMQIVYQFIMRMYADYVIDAEEKGQSFGVPYFVESIKQFAKANMEGRQWAIEKQMPMPSFEEYAENSYTTTCLTLCIMGIVPGLKSVTRETLDWVLSKPKISVSGFMIGRYMNDLATHQRESKDPEVRSAVDYFMNQYGTSRQESLSKFKEMVEDHWKNINEEWVNNTYDAPKEIVDFFLNVARSSELFYKNSGDGFTSPKSCFAPQIATLLNVTI